MEHIIEWSDKRENILLALFHIQTECENPSKSSYNPFTKSKYADLRSVLDAISTPMKLANALHVSGHRVEKLDVKRNPAWQKDWKPKTRKEQDGMQPPPELFICWVLVETTIFHVKSGQWVKSSIRLRSDNISSQAIGSCLTYGRRYNLVAMLDLATEDDDGNGGKKQQPTQQPTQTNQFATAPKKLRANINRDLTEQTTETGFQEVYIKFVKENGINMLDSETTHRKGETFRSIFDDHYQRIKNIEKHAGKKNQDEYAAWEEQIKACNSVASFHELEQTYADNCIDTESSWENDDAEKLINKAGKRLKAKGY